MMLVLLAKARRFQKKADYAFLEEQLNNRENSCCQ
jgi:hypothetical protein